MSQPISEYKRILFRCDGTAKTGLGHVSRSLALAEAMIECGFSCKFIGQFEAGATELLGSAQIDFERNIGETGQQEDLCSTIQAIQDSQATAVVVDSYLIGDAYIAILEREGAPVLLIDDFGNLERYNCSAVLNFTVNAAQIDYPRRKQLYLGPEYFLARRRLRLMRRKARQRTGAVERVLVAIGGVDVSNLSRLVVEALLKIAPDFSVHVVVGRSYQYTSDLSPLVAKFRRASYVVTQLPDLAEELAWADICICGGGLTKYEAAYMGVPTVVWSQTLAQAQETVHFASRGLTFDLGLANNNDSRLATRLAEFLADHKRRESLSHTGLTFFPPEPTKRAAEAFAKLVN